MRMRFLIPGDRDFTGAPAPASGRIFFDAVAGTDNNDGLSAAKAKRSLAFLPSVMATAGTNDVVLRKGDRQIYRRSSVQNVINSTIWTLSATGGSGNPVQVRGWGDGDKPFIGGDVLTLNAFTTDYGAVSNSFSNSWMSSNGEEGLAPSWMSIWHGLFLGRDMFTPSFWCPNSPGSNPSWDGSGSANSGTLADACRWDYWPTFFGSEAIFGFAGSTLVQDAPSYSAPDWTATYDASKKVRFRLFNVTDGGGEGPIQSGDEYYTEMEIEHPAIAARYGAVSPVGAVVRYRSNPANQNSYMVITGYNQGTSTITCRSATATISSGGPVHMLKTGSSYWGILGHPFDVVQEGQCAVIPTDVSTYANQLSSTKRVYIARASWMAGCTSVSGWYKICTLSGDYVTFDSIVMGRQLGADEEATGNWALNPGSTSHLTMADCEFRQAHSRASDSMVFWTGGTGTDVDVTNIYFGECGQLGGMRGGSFLAGTIDGLTAEELGRTALLLRSDGNGLTVSNVTGVGNRTVHGNITSTYATSRNITITKTLTTDSILNSTSQVEGTFTVGRNITYSSAIATPPRKISTTTGASHDGVDCISLDDGFNNSLYDRIWAPIRADTRSVRLSGGGAVDDQGNENNGGVFRRVVADGLSLGSGVGDPDPSYPGGAVEVTSCLSTNSSNSTAAWASPGGCTVTDSEVDASAASEGGISLKAWEYLTRTAPFVSGSPTYETFQLGPDWVDWQIPAYVPASPSTNAGTPVDLVISRSWYRPKHQAGRAVATVLRMRPGTNGNTPSTNGNFWIDPGYGNGASFFLDKGYLVPTIRLVANSYSLKIYEQTIGGEQRGTIITLTGRH